MLQLLTILNTQYIIAGTNSTAYPIADMPAATAKHSAKTTGQHRNGRRQELHALHKQLVNSYVRYVVMPMNGTKNRRAGVRAKQKIENKKVFIVFAHLFSQLKQLHMSPIM